MLLAVAFVVAPVRQPEVTYRWTPADGTAVALPLMPYQPTVLTATLGCSAARSGGLLLATVPPRPDPAAVPLDGLTLVGTSGGVTVTSAGTRLGTVVPPPGDCTLALRSDAAATTVSVDGAPVLEHPGDVRPDVAGIFTELAPAGFTGNIDPTADADPLLEPLRPGSTGNIGSPGAFGSTGNIGGLTVSLTADTRFATTPTPIKLALAVACLLALAALGVALARADRAGPTRRARLLPAGWWRPRPVDAAVTALLLVWWVIGAGTVDDGYIAGIVRSRGENGFVGNVYRWLNAPEAPFSWFYEPYHWWSQVSPSTPWLRLPSTLLGLLCWALVSRLLLPRLGRVGRRPGTAWVAALAFATWWVPLNLGLRPEPWVAVGGVLVFVAVERTLATHRLLPLAGALLTAGVSTAVTPAGVMTLAPVFAAAVPLVALLRLRTDLHLGRGAARALPLAAVAVAAPAAALLLMAADQGAAALVEAVQVRGTIAGARPWYAEAERYAQLVLPDQIQGAIGRRAAVLTTALAAAGTAWTLAATAPRVGIAAGPTRRLLVTLALSAAAMTFTPTKWTQHFGDLAGLGTAALTLGLVAFGRTAGRRLAPGTARRRRTAGLAGVTVVGALVLAGQAMWPFVYGWYRPTFSTVPPLVNVPPLVRDLPVASVALGIGGALVAVLLGRSVWRRGTGRAEPGPTGRWLPAPATAMAVVLVAVLALQVGGLARIAVAHSAGYTPTADALATVRGDPCGLQSALLVETDPAAGVLPVAPPSVPARSVVPEPTLPPARPATVDLGGAAVPGIAVTNPGATAWYTLDARQRERELPVVVTVTGPTRPGDELAAEFGQDGHVVGRVPLTGSGGPADRRLLAPPGADTVRLSVAAVPAAVASLDDPAPVAPSDDTAVASLPRAPVLTPMTALLPRGTTAILDWPVAFVFPCLTPEPLALGTAGLARWRVAPPADDASADIAYTPGLGGPFAGPRLLVTQHRMPTYVRDDPLRDGPRLYRWDPVVPLRTLTPSVRIVDVVSPVTTPHLRVPRLASDEE